MSLSLRWSVFRGGAAETITSNYKFVLNQVRKVKSNIDFFFFEVAAVTSFCVYCYKTIGINLWNKLPCEQVFTSILLYNLFFQGVFPDQQCLCPFLFLD